MTNKEEALRMALEALEDVDGIDTETECVTIDVGEAIAALRQAIEESEKQEPVAWRYTDARGHYRYRGYVPGFDVEHPLLKPQALYTTPPAAQRQWVGLTDEEISKTFETKVWDARRSYARAIEAKLKEKNT